MGIIDTIVSTIHRTSGMTPHKSAGVIMGDVQDYAIMILNQAFQADPEAITQLFGPTHRVLCNDELADHPTIQVRAYGQVDGDPGIPSVGVLGLINGLLAAEGNAAGAIAMMIDKDTGKLAGFTRYKPRVETTQ